MSSISNENEEGEEMEDSEENENSESLSQNKKENNSNKINEQNQSLNNTKSEIELTRKDNGKTLKSLNIKNQSTIIIKSNGLEQQIPDSEILDNEREVTEETIKIFNEWYDKYSTNNKMDAVNLSHFVRDVTNNKEEVKIKTNMKSEKKNQKMYNFKRKIQ